jgi:hypothetical protein
MKLLPEKKLNETKSNPMELPKYDPSEAESNSKFSDSLVNPEETLVGFVSDIFAKTASNKPISEMFKGIQNGKWKKEIIKLREIYAEDPEKYSQAKKKLPCFLISMSSNGGTKGEDVLNHSGLLQLDFDKLENTEIIDLKHKIGKDPYILGTLISPSGTGIKAVMRIPADIAGHKKIFKNVEKYILKNYGKSIDPACSDLGRKCIVSYDEDLIFNENAAIFLEDYAPDVEIAKNPKKKKIKSEFTPNADQKLLEELLNFSNSKLSKLYLNHVDLEFNFVENGERNKTVIEIVSKLFTIVSPEIILEFLEKYWLQHSSTFVGYE